MKSQMVRQGDVLLVPIKALPKAAKALEVEGRIILAYGEATGHHHSLRATVGSLYDHEQKRYLRMNIDAPLEHQEHAPILVPKGTYLVVRQREYSPEAIRNVAD